ncbi:hypothetical protein BT69DRAFT_1291641 [Atractiella rhizophila]|nr:hypothetical protein BT69DRAFT_1291641 [Atractiella rhizophila]
MDPVNCEFLLGTRVWVMWNCRQWVAYFLGIFAIVGKAVQVWSFSGNKPIPLPLVAHMRNAPLSKVLSTFMRDGVLYFTVVSLCNLVNMIYFRPFFELANLKLSIPTVPNPALKGPLALTFTTMMASHIVLQEVIAKTPAPVVPLGTAISFQSFGMSVGRRMEGGLQVSYAGVIVDVETEINVEKRLEAVEGVSPESEREYRLSDEGVVKKSKLMLALRMSGSQNLSLSSGKGIVPAYQEAFGAFDNEVNAEAVKYDSNVILGTDHENAPYFQSLAYGAGRVWYIPLQGRVSVGLVHNEVLFKKIRKEFTSAKEYCAAVLKEALKYDSDLGRTIVSLEMLPDPTFPSSVHMWLDQKIKHQDVRVTETESYQPAIDIIKPVIQGKVDVRTGDGFKAKYQSVPAGPGYENYKLATEVAKPNHLGYSDAKKATYEAPCQLGYSAPPYYKDTGLDKEVAGSIGIFYSWQLGIDSNCGLKPTLQVA